MASRTFLTLVASLFCAGGVLLALPANAETPLTRATIQKLKNEVVLTAKQQGRREAKVQDVMTPGDALQTFQKAMAELRFNDRSLARIGEQAIFNFEPNTRTLDLKSGTVLLLIKPGQGRTRVRTPNAAAGIRGSALFIRHLPDSNVTMVGALTNSDIEISNKDGSQTVVLKAGQLGYVHNDRIGVFNFDQKLFQETSPFFKDIDWNEAPVEVKEEINAALQSQSAIAGKYEDTPDWTKLAENRTSVPPTTALINPLPPTRVDQALIPPPRVDEPRTSDGPRIPPDSVPTPRDNVASTAPPPPIRPTPAPKPGTRPVPQPSPPPVVNTPPANPPVTTPPTTGTPPVTTPPTAGTPPISTPPQNPAPPTPPIGSVPNPPTRPVPGPPAPPSGTIPAQPVGQTGVPTVPAQPVVQQPPAPPPQIATPPAIPVAPMPAAPPPAPVPAVPVVPPAPPVAAPPAIAAPPAVAPPTPAPTPAVAPLDTSPAAALPTPAPATPPAPAVTLPATETVPTVPTREVTP